MKNLLVSLYPVIVSFVTKALKWVPGITAADFDVACDELAAQIQNAKGTFDTVATESDALVAEQMVGDGLSISQAILDAKGITSADKWIEAAEQFDALLEGQGGTTQHPFLLLLKSWFGKKKANPAASQPVSDAASKS
jgi:hypothetical protein